MVQDITTMFLAATGKLAKTYDIQALLNSHILKNTGKIIEKEFKRSSVAMLMCLTIKVYSIIEFDSNDYARDEKDKKYI